MKTIIEAGHFYSVNGPTKFSVEGWQHGKEIAETMPPAQLALFVDDYHTTDTFHEPEYTLLDAEATETARQSMIVEADHVFYEAAIAKGAIAKAQDLLEDGSVKLKKGAVSVAGIRLGTMFDHKFETFKPTCTFLDYLLLGEKAKLSPMQITVLPYVYKKQQEQLKNILGYLAVPGLAMYEPYIFWPPGRDWERLCAPLGQGTKYP